MGRNNHQKVTSEWIPVTERFPKNISTVIVQVKEIENPTLRNRTEELCEHANNFEETYQIGCELKNIGRLIQGMSLHIRDLQDKVNSQAEHIKTLLEKAGDQND